MNKRINCDIAIAGGGLSGLFAAIRAAELGVQSVAVFEAGSVLGGNGRKAATFVSSDFADYGDYSSDKNAIALFEKTMSELNGTGNPEVIRRYLFNTRKIARWLELKEVSWAALTWGMFKSDCSLNVESPGYNDGFSPSLGTVICNTLVSELKKHPNVTIYLKTRVVRLLTDSSHAVSGLVATCQDEVTSVKAKRVILSCGGVAGTEASLCRFLPEYMQVGDSIRIRGMSTCVGDGIKMAAQIGADTNNSIQLHMLGPEYGGYSGPLFSPLTDVVRDPRCVVLNGDGVRIMDESMFMKAQELTNHQPKKVLYAVADSRVMETLLKEKGRYITQIDGLSEKLTSDIDREYLFVAKCLDEAAVHIGCRYDDLLSSIDEYNRFCQIHNDGKFGKSEKYLFPVTKPPFYVMRAVRSVDSTNGGITINDGFQALRPDGTAIAGMYVTGDHASGFVSQYYAPAGAGMTWAMVSGYLSGEDAAMDINA